MKALTEREIQKFKTVLLEQKTEIMNVLKQTPFENVKDAEPTGDEADKVNSELSVSMSFQLRERERMMMQQIESALSRISQGTFGLCVECEEVLGADRLSVRPHATRCLSCQEDAEFQFKILHS